ncbi:MAG: DUF2130 domain-containing protein [Cyclobacteriaceae bacterium]|nr:DUF2130 domain-containing protein [Cyclobacteriaceae bacterium SS2]
MKTNMNITCPNCQHEFSAEDAFRKHLDVELKAELEQAQKDYQTKKADLVKREKELDQLINEGVKAKEGDLRKAVSDELEKEFGSSLDQYKKKIEQQSEQIKTLRSKEIEIEDLRSKLKDQEQEYELKYKRQLNEKLEEERIKSKESASEEYELKLRKQDKMLEDQRVQIETMKKKIEQGSMQLQGEVQELIIEERLIEMFPQDEIGEVGKGMKGADVIQTVISEGVACGSIIYESKNTANFSMDWVDKLRTDQIAAGCQTAVLVTKTMPRGFEGDYFVEKNVVVCTPKLFPVVAALCRTKTIDLKYQASRFETQKDKMGLMYQYLTGEEFRMHIEEVVMGIMEIKDQVDKERVAFEKQWKQRDKQADRMISNLAQMFGSIKGIGGTSIKEIKSLELLS